MQPSLILVVSSMMLRTNSATEVQVKKPSSSISSAGLNSQIKQHPVQTSALSNGKLPSNCSLTPTWHWLQSPHSWGLPCGVSSCQEKPPEHVCKCFALRGTTTLPQCCSLSLQGGGADLQPGPHMAWASERCIDPIVTMVFSKVQNADGKLSLANSKEFLKSPVCLAYKKSIGVLTYKVHCTVNFIFYSGGQEIVRSDII